MTTLVLCIDRDNDLGRKAGAPPVILGREANVQWATRLLLADPEESDANSIFGAVAAYDELVKDGVAAEVVTIAGDERVGTTSDRKLTERFDAVLAQVKPDRCVFVTDGAEDEFILPLVTSRVRVDAVRRIIVKQNADIEGTYYVIKKALEDDKIQRTFFIPLALGLLVYGLFALLGQTDKGLGAITLTVGFYFLAKALHIGEYTRRILRDFYSGLSAGRVSLFMSMLALFVLVAGLIVTVQRGMQIFPEKDPWEQVGLRAILDRHLAWWVILAALLAVGGKVLDARIREGTILWSYWILPFSLVATGILVEAALGAVLALLRGEAFPMVQSFLSVLLGFTIAFLGSISNAYIRESRHRAPRAKRVASER